MLASPSVSRLTSSPPPKSMVTRAWMVVVPAVGEVIVTLQLQLTLVPVVEQSSLTTELLAEPPSVFAMRDRNRM